MQGKMGLTSITRFAAVSKFVRSVTDPYGIFREEKKENHVLDTISTQFYTVKTIGRFNSTTHK